MRPCVLLTRVRPSGTDVCFHCILGGIKPDGHPIGARSYSSPCSRGYLCWCFVFIGIAISLCDPDRPCLCGHRTRSCQPRETRAPWGSPDFPRVTDIPTRRALGELEPNGRVPKAILICHFSMATRPARHSILTNIIHTRHQPSCQSSTIRTRPHGMHAAPEALPLLWHTSPS